jgi:hypothetical protein
MHRTTFRIDEELLAEAKSLAARQHRSLNSVMEEALRRMLAIAQDIEDRPPVSLTTYGSGGVLPGVDINPADLKAYLASEDAEHFLEVTHRDAAGHQRAGVRTQK